MIRCQSEGYFHGYLDSVFHSSRLHGAAVPRICRVPQLARGVLFCARHGVVLASAGWAFGQLPDPNAPFKGNARVIEAEISGLPTNNVGPGYLSGDDNRALWFTLDVRVVMDHTYMANYAICSFRGPIIYSPQHGFLDSSSTESGTRIGERRIIVSMVAASLTAISYFPDEFYPGFEFFGPIANTKKVFYLSTTETDVMTRDDEMEWCRVGPDMGELAASLHLTVDEHGVIQGDRVTWIGHHHEFPIDALHQDEAATAVVDAVSQAEVQ